jgi:predicted MFS family arabinose efflux permease
MSQLKALWSIPEFRPLLAARIISNYGNGMAPIALSFGVLGIEGAGPTDLSWVMGAQAVALVIFLPFGGVWADRLSRTRVISVTDMVLSGFIFTMAALFLTDNVTIPALVVLNFVAGALNALWYPAFPGLTPEVVKNKDLLQGANGAIATSSNLGLITGAASGGILVATLGAGYALAIDATTFLIAGILIFSIRHVSTARTQVEKKTPSMITELKEGWTTFLSFRWIFVIVAAFSIIGMMLQGTIAVLGPVLMKREYNGALSWAAVTTALSIGYLAGALIGSKFRPKRPLAFAMMLTLTAALWLFSMAAGAPLTVIAIGSFLWGFTIEIFSIFWFTAMQTHVPEESLSRVASYDAFGSLFFWPLGIAIAGPAVALVGIDTSLWIAGCVVVGMVLLALLEKSIWRVQWKESNTQLPDPYDASASPLTPHQPTV